MATAALVRPTAPWWAGPVVICSVMIGCAAVIDGVGGPSPWPIALRYIAASLLICGTAVAVWAFIEVAKLATVRADRPLSVVWERLKPKLPLLALPAFVLPAFLGGYTAAKIAMPNVVGFRFDPVLADLDALIFGDDPWRYTHAVIGPVGTEIIEMFYVAVWIAVLGYSKAMVALFASRKFIITFFTAMMLTWFLGGFIGAYLLSSAGPTFIQLNGMEWRFAELKLSLLQFGDSQFINGPGYLDDRSTLEGAGISAMPSMHMAACSIYVLASRGTRWLVPACLFWVVIFIGSIHSGYHYAVDAPVAALIAWISWKLSVAVQANYGSIYEPIG